MGARKQRRNRLISLHRASGGVCKICKAKLVVASQIPQDQRLDLTSATIRYVDNGQEARAKVAVATRDASGRPMLACNGCKQKLDSRVARLAGFASLPTCKRCEKPYNRTSKTPAFCQDCSDTIDASAAVRAVVVSRHAVRRYSERIRKMPPEEIRQEIAESIKSRCIAGQAARNECGPWLRLFSDTHNGRPVELFYDSTSKAAFLTVRDPDRSLVVLTCFRAVCTSCGKHHGTADKCGADVSIRFGGQ